MTRNELNNEYFEWLCELVCSDERYFRRLPYRRLLRYLHSVDFRYTIAMDGNRAENGVNLRYRFGDENSYRDAMIASYLDYRPCSVLEMMVALAIRCEERIMDDPDIGNRTGQWFWDMIDSLGLKQMSDIAFDRVYVENVVEKFLDRDYKPNGEGGLFTVENCDRDMRDTDIYYQMCWYLREIV